MEGKCWWCGIESIRPLCKYCSNSKHAVRNVTQAIKRGSKPVEAMGRKISHRARVSTGRGSVSYAVLDRGSLISYNYRANSVAEYGTKLV